MILVTAATGQIGNQAARGLIEIGRPVRALVRDPTRALGLDGAEVAVGSFEDDAALARALDGVETLFLAGRDGPDAAEHHLRALHRASRAGVRHIVKLSAIGARADSPIALMREHDEVDAAVERTGAGWTLVRPHLFMQNLLRAADGIRRQGVISAPMGSGAYPLVDTRDIGSVCAAILADPAPHASAIRVLTGPAAVTYDEVAAAFAQVAGREVRYEPVDPFEQERRLLDAGMPAWRAFDLAHITSAYTSEDHAVTTTIADVLGRPPRTLAQFVRDHVHPLRGSTGTRPAISESG
jgi:uncharacterized protein YbjT (DUF2867 family)